MKIEVNRRTIEAQPGEMLLSVLRRAGISVPTLCHMENLLPTGACRLCVVEVEGQRALVPSCSYPAAEGMKVMTHSARAVAARKTIVELLLSNHPDDCLYCARNNDCTLQSLASEMGVSERTYSGAKNQDHADISSPALVRDPAKCVLCGKCVRVCEEVQGVSALDFIGRGSGTRVGPAFNEGLNVSSCVACGQCIMVCPTGALTEQNQTKKVLSALRDTSLTVVVQHAPAVSVTLAEEFGLPPGTEIGGILTAALRRLGFDRVFDTAFSADLTVMEEASELARRISTGGPLPMLTSCSPGWIKFVEEFYPDFLPNLSTCKSPQQMLGAVVKSHYARKEGLDPETLYSVALMPCTAKKFEASRPEMVHDGIADIDAVLTTRELAQLIRMHGLDLRALAPEEADRPFGERSSAGKLFGASGGVMEAAVRTAYFLLTGGDLEDPEIPGLRGLNPIKEAHVNIGGRAVGIAAVSGLANARKLLEQIRGGRSDLHFIEVMTCPGGCIGGGGQPIGADRAALRARMQALYSIDHGGTLRTAHANLSIRALYDEFLGEPLGERSHALLHTHYSPRQVVV
jgi:NADH-quinone oxidoreductase subunit G/NADP-reducing hydrogenase subunit HndD